MKKQLMLILGMLFVSGYMMAQVTSGAISGKVVDSKKQPLQGAKVKITHVPSGSVYGSSSRSNGEYEVRALRVGGPYTVEVSYLGKGKDRVDNVYVTLGEPISVDLTLEESATLIKEVLVTSARNSIINENRTGAATNINSTMINSMPTGNRTLSDMTRLSPQSGASFSSGLNNANTFGGRDGRYNNLQVNGANLNNGFGLSSNLAPGGSGQPISLDAIEEIQVGVSPFDIRQTGFTGANINAVTRSGTNEWHGSAYTFQKTNGLVGDKVDTVNLDVKKNTNAIYGARLGGPIVKNKLFIFGNFETERNAFPGNTWVTKTGGFTGNESNVSRDSLVKFQNFLRNHPNPDYRYDPGAFEGYGDEFVNQNMKFLGRVDWNINENNKFYVSYSQMNSSEDNLVNATSAPNGLDRLTNGRVSRNALSFENSNYSFDHLVRTVSAELNSSMNPIMHNQLLATYSYIRDERKTPGSIFPFIDITNGGTNNYMSAGSELFSYKNDLINTNFIVTDNLNIDLKDNQLTIGASFENQLFENSFLGGGNLYYRYNSLADFMNNARPSAFSVAYPLASQNGNTFVKASYSQLSAYIQDKFTLSKRLTLTGGIRFELPFYDNSHLTANPAVDALKFNGPDGQQVSFKSGQFPAQQLMVSPRLAFNWDALGNRNLQVRGGLGVFTGRIPFVWLTNQAGGIGTATTNYNLTPPTGSNVVARNIGFYTSLEDMKAKNPTEYARLPQSTNALPATVVVVDPEFKMPQVLRGDLGIDYKLPWYGLIATAELMVSRDINNVYQYNANLPAYQSTLNNTSDQRPRWTNNRLNASINQAFVLTNTNQGYSTVLSFGIARQARKGLYGSFFYTRTISEDVSSNPGSQASSAWNSLPNISSPNDAVMTTSQYNTPHRLVGSLAYKFEYGKNKMLATTVSFFFEGANPGRYSYLYSSDINNDRANTDLIYIPKTENDINWTEIKNGSTVVYTIDQQKAIWKQFVEQDEYLNENKGQYASRYGSQYPWYTRMDMRLLQDFSFKIKDKKHTIQLSWDVINLPNLLNSAWGVQKQLAIGGLSNNNPVLRPETLPNSSTLTNPSNPKYTLNYDNNTFKVLDYSSTFINNNSVFSTWSMQLGARYTF